MKCPKCSLVTFDHLSKCPRCETSFGLHRRLTRRRNDPARPILIPREEDDLQAAPESASRHPDAATRAAATSTATAGRTDTPGAPAPAGSATAAAGPRLSDLAASEREADIEVKVSAAMEAARATLREESDQTTGASATAPTGAAGDAAEEAELQLDESQRIKERMKRAGRARRRKRPEYTTETIDPVLPDWYEPDLEAADEGDRPVARSTNRR